MVIRSSAATGVAPAAHRVGRRVPLKAVSRFIRRQPVGGAAALLLVVVSCLCFASRWLAPYDPNVFHYSNVLAAPNSRFLAGTDNFGRDILSRLLYGGRISLLVTTTGVIGGAVVGTVLGLVSGYHGRWLDIIIQRLADALMSFPLLVLALALVSVLGPSVQNVAVAIAVSQVPTVTKVTRAVTLGLREEQFVQAAVTTGAATPRVLLRHVLPNLFAPLIVLVTTALGTAVLVEASLSFLSLGPPPPNATWGSMLSGDARQYFTRAPWMAIFPGMAISVVVLSISMLGDALRDYLDPRLRNR